MCRSSASRLKKTVCKSMKPTYPTEPGIYPTRNGARLHSELENHHAIYGKTMGKPWENGDLYGKIMKDPPCYLWENSLFLWPFSVAFCMFTISGT